MSFHTYKQDTKNRVRHTVIRKAVELLTSYRSEACCVRNSYVRDLHDYFVSVPETHEKCEAEKIDHSYIREWEQMHSSLIGIKRPSELSVCYLSGTSIEILVRRKLFSVGYCYRVNYKVLPGKPDIVFTKKEDNESNINNLC